jgi:hypothetical protein
MRVRTFDEDRVSTFMRPGRVGLAKLAKEATAEDDLIALADRGCYEGDEILEYERAGCRGCSQSDDVEQRRCWPVRRDPVYDGKTYQYPCPAGSVAITE